MNNQQQLVSAIFKAGYQSDFNHAGLAIYQNNLIANAITALKISFPTVVKLIGDDVFAIAVQQLLQQDPPDAGDWGLWGENFSEVLNNLPALQEFQYVADIAQLDFSLHVLARAKDHEVDLSNLSLLADCELDQLRLVLNPTIKISNSAYPVRDIYQANTVSANSSEPYLIQAKQKLGQGLGQASLIYRPQFNPLIRALDSAEQAWLELLQQGESIGHALDRLSEDNLKFSLEEWLPLAIQQNLILQLEKI